MSEEAARAVVWLVTIVALGVWMSAVRFVARVRNAGRRREETERFVFDPRETRSNQLVGHVVVQAPVMGLSEKLARALAQPQISQFGAVKVTSVDADRVAFEQVERDRQSGLRIGAGEIRLLPAGPTTSVAHYRAAIEPGRGRLFAASIVLAAGLPAIGAMWLAMEYFVVSNPHPQVRWQSLQSLQLVHILWPPFQLAALDRASRTAATARIEAMLVNLPHLP
jgi:hypothetical protein